MKHMGDDGDMEIMKKIDTMLNVLREKEGELEDLEALNQALIVKERKSNDELQEARKELISVSIYFFLFNTYYFVPINILKLSNCNLSMAWQDPRKCALSCKD